jgi:uncharacterized protein YyaL (SSP411 family)
MRVRLLIAAILLCTTLCVPAASGEGIGAESAAQPSKLSWQPWSDAVFAQARTEHKFVLLDLEAVWCHWCHVMDEITYADPIVMRLLNERYILVKVDQDARPDISNRYQDWGWPATIVFAADGSEIVKRQGYIPPRPMSSMLQAIIDDPSPGPSVEKEADFHAASDAAIGDELLKRIYTAYDNQYDKDAAGWGFGHKYLDADSVELALRLGAEGDAAYAKCAADTLDHAAALIDPVWGGMYQYSVDGVWSEPHFEKLISIQADALREYSLAYAQTQRPEYLKAAQDVNRYVAGFLTSSEDGAFYVSQDADLHDGEENAAYFKLSDSERRKQGIPRVDKHEYARENGRMISALATYYAASGDASALTQAKRAAGWVRLRRAIPATPNSQGVGYGHGENDPAGPYLADTLFMGQGLLDLYIVDGDREDLRAAMATEKFIAVAFAPEGPGLGFVSSRTATDAAFRPHPDREENIALVRFASMLAFITGDEQIHATAAEAMRYVAAEQVALRPLSAGVLLANDEFNAAPIHVTIVGSPSDPAAIALHDAALRSIVSSELIEVRDPADPSPSPTSIEYPKLDRAALFLCTARACSAPVYKAEDVRKKVERAVLQSGAGAVGRTPVGATL